MTLHIVDLADKVTQKKPERSHVDSFVRELRKLGYEVYEGTHEGKYGMRLSILDLQDTSDLFALEQGKAKLRKITDEHGLISLKTYVAIQYVYRRK